MIASRHFYAMAGIVTLLSASALSTSHGHTLAAATNPLAVTVMNGNGNPVPVTLQGTNQIGGTVAVNSLPAVQLAGGTSVGITGTPTVSLSAGTSVTATLPAGSNVSVNNDPAHPVPVKDASSSTRIPITVTTNFNIGDSFNSIGHEMYSVPAGKRLVILTIFGQASMPSGQTMISAEIGSIPLHLSDPRGPSTDLIAVFKQDAVTQVTETFNAFDFVGGGVERNATSDLANCTLGFTGYLEDAP